MNPRRSGKFAFATFFNLKMGTNIYSLVLYFVPRENRQLNVLRKDLIWLVCSVLIDDACHRTLIGSINR